MKPVSEHDQKLIDQAIETLKKKEAEEREIIKREFLIDDKTYESVNEIFDRFLKHSGKRISWFQSSPIARKMFIAGYLVRDSE